MEIDFNEEEKQELIKLISKRVSKRQIKSALKEAIKDMLSEDMVDRFVEKASEKAIKDLSKYKAIRESTYCNMKIEKLERNFERTIQDVNNYQKDLQKVLKYFNEVIKT